MAEQSEQQQTLIALQMAYPDAVIDRRNVGVATDTRTGQVVKFGRKGQADVWGIFNGLHIEIEMKSRTGRQSKHQQNWQKAVERAGGVYILARTWSEALENVRDTLGSE